MALPACPSLAPAVLVVAGRTTEPVSLCDLFAGESRSARIATAIGKPPLHQAERLAVRLAHRSPCFREVACGVYRLRRQLLQVGQRIVERVFVAVVDDLPFSQQVGRVGDVPPIPGAQHERSSLTEANHLLGADPDPHTAHASTAVRHHPLALEVGIAGTGSPDPAANVRGHAPRRPVSTRPCAVTRNAANGVNPGEGALAYRTDSGRLHAGNCTGAKRSMPSRGWF